MMDGCLGIGGRADAKRQAGKDSQAGRGRKFKSSYTRKASHVISLPRSASAPRKEGKMIRTGSLALVVGLIVAAVAPAQTAAWRFRWQQGQVLDYNVNQVT